jgi:hypothetical protein
MNKTINTTALRFMWNSLSHSMRWSASRQGGRQVGGLVLPVARVGKVLETLRFRAASNDTSGACRYPIRQVSPDRIGRGDWNEGTERI